MNFNPIDIRDQEANGADHLGTSRSEHTGSSDVMKGSYWNLITKKALSTIHLISFVLAIYFAFAHLHLHSTIHIALNISPIDPTLSISISSPLLAFTSVTAVAYVALAIHKAINKEKIDQESSELLGEIAGSSTDLQGLTRHSLHIKGRSSEPTEEEIKAAWEKAESRIAVKYPQLRDKMKKVTFSPRGGDRKIKLKGYWGFKHKDLPTVILFHGTGGNISSMSRWAEYYYDKLGYNFLMVEYRGYGVSGGIASGPNQELESYLDAEAALKFVLDKGISKDRILTHGYSLGGSYAASLGKFFDIKTVILDHTFTTYAEVASNIIGGALSPASVERIIKKSFRKKTMLARTGMNGAKGLETDGWNNIKKVKDMEGKIFIIQGKTDGLMKRKFGMQMILANYKDTDDWRTCENRMVTIDGGHSAMKNFFKDGRAQYKHLQYLEAQGLETKDLKDSLNKL